MKILVTGATGFIGAPLVFYFQQKGHEVLTLSLSKDPNQFWDLDSVPSLESLDVVIHLAGEPLSLSYWSKKKKEKIYQSRVFGTRSLVEILSKQKSPPKIFISASAVGIYGDQKDTLLNEKSPLGSGFLSKVCIDWEKEGKVLERLNVRTVQARFGVVLGEGGGILEKILPLYRWHLGAVLGTGLQWMSWIEREDLIRAIDHIIHSNLKGAVNVCSPHPVTQRAFSEKVAKKVQSCQFLRLPGPLLKIILGDMAREMILPSIRVFPLKLLESGFSFNKPFLIIY